MNRKQNPQKSGAIKTPIPFNEAAQALLDRCGWSESNLPHQVVHIGTGDQHLTGLDGEHIFVCFLSQALFKHFNKMTQFHRLIIADVVQTIGSVAGGRV